MAKGDKKFWKPENTDQYELNSTEQQQPKA